jgi:ubiquinone/menaquinone biosynthesis C-methylase UbiE
MSQKIDWDEIAEKFDLWIPQLIPVADALIEALAARPGDRILDLACGTGEPTLSLARRMGDAVRITSIDAAAPMVDVAARKGREAGISNVEWCAMPGESLAIEDNVFDRALSRFGFMLFEDPLAGLREMHRVLKPGGRFAFAVWASPQQMPTLYWAHQAFAGRVPEEAMPPVGQICSLGDQTVLSGLLREVGFNDFAIAEHSFDYDFPSFDAFWDTVEMSGVLANAYAAVSDKERPLVRESVRELARQCEQDGRFVAPNTYVLACGVKDAAVN